MTAHTVEVNFDGIVGPTHNYSGLSYGNVASINNQKAVSNPKAAALQGLEKMYHLTQLGLPQAFLPPHERPHIPTLRALGFSGSYAHVLTKAAKEAPELLMACCSAAAMWTANAATVSPSIDSGDRHVHITPANLTSKFHRAIEAPATNNILKAIFSNRDFFTVHPPLPSGSWFADEGAANHTRFCRTHGSSGLHLFVYGKKAFSEGLSPSLFPARQSDVASQAVARNHQIGADQTLFVQQNPEAIDAGVFHNDVISVGNQDFFLFHEKAFIDTPAVIQELKRKMAEVCQLELKTLEVKEHVISLQEAVDSYLFNSQILTMPDQTVVMIAPSECQKLPKVHLFLEEMLASSNNPVSQVHYFNLHESMRNGGGPACLRLRVVLTRDEMAALPQAVFLNEERYRLLKKWIETHYRDRLTPEDLVDPQLLHETREALDALTQLLQLGSLYDFQR